KTMEEMQAILAPWVDKFDEWLLAYGQEGIVDRQGRSGVKQKFNNWLKVEINGSNQRNNGMGKSSISRRPRPEYLDIKD
ncbi:MAG: hypothetical protein KBS70_04985, partial [Bacteroidales bacterium]|nr:hypothetical protein [Candidatus Colicola equi]